LRVRGGHPVAQPVPAFRLADRVIVGEHPHRPLEGEPAPTVDVGDRGAAAPFGVARLLGPPPGDHAGQSTADVHGEADRDDMWRAVRRTVLSVPRWYSARNSWASS